MQLYKGRSGHGVVTGIVIMHGSSALMISWHCHHDMHGSQT
jgi:hypothetical protein